MSESGGTQPSTITGTVRQFRDSSATTHGYASSVAPAATAAICTLAVPSNGLYELVAYFAYGATGDVAGNVRAQKNAVVVSNIPNPGGSNVAAPPFVAVVQCVGGDVLSVNAVLAGAAGSIYIAAISARLIG
jgi:hypothetical protein